MKNHGKHRINSGHCKGSSNENVGERHRGNDSASRSGSCCHVSYDSLHGLHLTNFIRSCLDGRQPAKHSTKSSNFSGGTFPKPEQKHIDITQTVGT